MTLKNILMAGCLLAALGAPVAALAGDAAPAAPSKMALPPAKPAVETTNLLTKAAQDSVTNWVPKYLTIQQQNDAAQREFEERYHVIHMP